MADYAGWSPNHAGRGGDSVIWLAVHTAEGATTAASLANYLANPTNQGSYHDVCDDSTTIQCVDYAEEAWAMLGGNPRSDQVCCTGFAAWSTSTWLSHQGMLDRIARWLAQRARVRGIPLDHIGPTGVADRAPGVIGHWDYTIGAHDGTHTDPGPNFPWDYVITKARQHNRTGDDLMSQGTWDPCTKDSNGNITEYPVPTANAGLAGLAGFSDGGIWIAESNASAIVRFDVAAHTFGTPRPTLTANAAPTQIVTCPDGQTLCFTENNAAKLGQITPAGVVTEHSLAPATSAFGLVGGADFNLYFTDRVQNQVGQISGVSFGVSEFAIPTASAQAAFMSLGPDLEIYFTETGTNKVARLTYF